MEIPTIKWLEIDQFKILKQIVLISVRNNNEIELGSLLYTRALSTEYNLMKQHEEDQKESNTLSRLLQEYPKQENYPEDEIDIIILKAIRREFPQSFVRNHTIFFNIDMDKLSTLKNRNVITSSISFSPEFSKIHDIYQYAGKEFRAPRCHWNIYSYYSSERLIGINFFANYDATDNSVLDKLQTVHFE